MVYDNQIQFVRRKILYNEEAPLGEMLDIDGDGKLSIKDLWLWKKRSNTYKIKMDITGGDEDDADILRMAASRWEQIISAKTSLDEHDLRIDVTFDGNLPSNILGQAGVTHYKYHQGHQIPYRGIMILSTKNWESQKLAKKSNGLTNAYYTVLHEMGHILGIGTMWSQNKLLNASGQYVGARALEEYRKIIKNPDAPCVPVEDDGGGGTAGYHVEEGEEPNVSKNDRHAYHDGNRHALPGLDRELMTGWAEVDAGPEPLSALSVAMLEDIGYTVNYAYCDDLDMMDINQTDGFINEGETLYMSFVEKESTFTTQVTGYNHINRLTYNLYLSSQARYLNPVKIKMRVNGGTVKLSKMITWREGSDLGEHVIYGDSNVVESEYVNFDIPENIRSMTKISIIFVGI